MTVKTPYQIKLLDPRWLATSRRIKTRDGWKCTACGEGGKLNVHHRYYVAKRAPWAYPDFALHTLCVECHGFEHDEPDELKEWERMAEWVFGTDNQAWAWDMSVAIAETVNKGVLRKRVLAAVTSFLTGGKWNEH